MSQKIELAVDSMPLNRVLIELRQKYDFQFSFNDDYLSQFSISASVDFYSKKDVVEFLLTHLPLQYELSNGVYIILPKEDKVKPRTFLVAGQVIEKSSREPLAYSHVLINDNYLATDLKGAFSLVSTSDSVFVVKASHLGCYVLDTVITSGVNHFLALTPASIGINEVVVRNSVVEKATQFGQAPGLTKLNHHIAGFLPGNGDNSVFNLLRLQPGVLAAGEQPNDLIIWGSSEGTTRVLFDGFTIWGLKNFNDNISAVNPFLAKTLDVFKGGYGVSKPDVAGGFVNITGKTGSLQKTGVNFFLNNQTANAMVEVPVTSKSSLLLAFRNTYYNIFESEGSDVLGISQLQGNNFEMSIDPQYRFFDSNFKFSTKGENGDLFYLSLLRASDKLSYVARQERINNRLIQKAEEDNRQQGGTLFYSKNWLNGNISDLKVSFSSLNTWYYRNRDVENIRRGTVISRVNESVEEKVRAVSAGISNYFPLNEKHALNMGVELVNDYVAWREDTFNVALVDISESASRLNLFLQDDISLGKNVNIDAGLRINRSFQLKKTYVAPRVAIKFRAGSLWKINGAWGRYYQFLVKSSIVDDYGNYRFSWGIANNETLPVIDARHLVVGAAFTMPDFMVNIEGFLKKSEGLTRFIRYKREELIFEGKDRAYGVDFYVKKDLSRHALWASYSLSKTEELFPYFESEHAYRRSPQDQRHEIKLSGLFALGNFYFSASYVWGSGFPLYVDYMDDFYTEPNYSRADISLIYKRILGKVDGEVGGTILNLFDQANVKYANFERVPLDQVNAIIVNTEAVGFTPTIYLKIRF